MIDKAMYLGTSGASDTMHQLEIVTNNLANVNTTGFRADFESKKQIPIHGKGLETRVYSASDQSYSDFNRGPIINTGRDLDVAIAGDGFIAVQTKSGKEGYTRAGDLQIRNGLLTTQSGELVLGNGGVIDFPSSAERMTISEDGTISVKIKGNDNKPININRIKLVNPAPHQLAKGNDGFFYLTGDQTTSHPDEKVRIMPGSLEGSNVNPIETMTRLIELSRRFEMHTNLMKTMQTDSSKANQILELPR